MRVRELAFEKAGNVIAVDSLLRSTENVAYRREKVIKLVKFYYLSIWRKILLVE